MTTTVEPRYEIEELVASGGMADVYRGRDVVLDRRVAIKRLRGPVDDGAARARFEREARLLAGFQHPNAVTVFDALDDADGPLIVMEYVEGESLRARLRASGHLSVEAATAIADQILTALAAAHAQGIVHRDVKPANVLVTADGHVKLADFGIATMTDMIDLTRAGEVVGTPKYLSPEQAVGERATPQSDLYSVGVLCFEMVCGHAPYEGETPSATLAAHRREPVPSLSDECPDAPGWFVAVVERALAKDPAQRYPDAEAMQTALRAGLRGDVTVADSTLALPIVVEPAVPADPIERRRAARWPVLVFVLVGALVALGVWALGSDDPNPMREPAPPTAAATVAPTVPPTVAPTVPPTVPPTAAPAGGKADKKGDDAGSSGPGPSGKNPPGQEKKGKG